jgi:hypothetical protein
MTQVVELLPSKRKEALNSNPAMYFSNRVLGMLESTWIAILLVMLPAQLVEMGCC